MKKTIIYTRVSTSEQANFGFSLARQKEDCINFAKRNNYEVSKVFVERGESAKTTERTELQNLIKYCSEHRKTVDALIIWKIDRLSRNMEDYYMLSSFFNKLNIEILSATEVNDNTATGKLTRNVLGAFAQFENDQKTERTKAGMKQALLEGKWLWKAPYGYKMINGDLFKDEVVAPIVERIFTLFSKGLYTQSQIIKLLEKENVFIKSGNMFNLLRNPLYCGKIYCPSLCEQVVKGAFEPIISEELFNKVQLLLNGSDKIVTSYIKNNPEFPLRHFILCPCCGSPLTASKSTGRKKKKYAYYHCYNPNCRTQVRVPKDKLEEIFVEYLDELQLNYQNLKDFKRSVKESYNQQIKEVRCNLNRLNQNAESLKLKKDKLLDFYLDEKIGENDYKLRSERLDKELQNLYDCISKIALPNDDFEKCLDYVCKAMENIKNIWLTSDLDTKQRLQQLIFPNGLIYENGGFRTAQKVDYDTKKGGLLPPDFKMVPPSEFESLSTP